MKQYIIIAAILAVFILVVGAFRWGMVWGVVGAVAVFPVILLIGWIKTRGKPPAA